MEQSVAHTGLMYLSRLRVRYFERLVRRVLVCFILQFLIKSNDVLHQSKLELLHILPAALAPQKFFPGREKIFDRNDIIVDMFKSDPAQSMKVAPPRTNPVGYV